MNSNESSRTLASSDSETVSPVLLKDIYNLLFGSNGLLKRISRDRFLREFFPDDWYQNAFGNLHGNSPKQYVSYLMNADKVNKKPRNDLLGYVRQHGTACLDNMEELCKKQIYREEMLLINSSKFSEVMQKTGENLFLYLSKVTPSFLSGNTNLLQQAECTLQSYLSDSPQKALSRLILSAALHEFLVQDQNIFSIIWLDNRRKLVTATDKEPDWGRATDEQRFNHAEELHELGKYEEAIQFLEWTAERIQDRHARTPALEYSEIEIKIFWRCYQYLQERTVYSGDNLYNKLHAFWYLDKCGSSEFAPALYTLARCYQSGDGCSKNPALALEKMKLAAHARSPQAIYDLGDAYFRGEKSLNCRKDRKKAEDYFKIGAGMGEEITDHEQKIAVAQCQYKLGKIAEERGDSEARTYYLLAAKANNILAKKRLWEMDGQAEAPPDPEKIGLPQEGICFLHNDAENNLIFADSLPDHWKVTVCDAAALAITTEKSGKEFQCSNRKIAEETSYYLQTLSQILQGLNWEENPDKIPLLVFALLDENETLCLHDAMLVIEELRTFLYKLSQGLRRPFVQKIRIFIRGTQVSTTLVLDSLLSMMQEYMQENLYFPVQIYDPDQEAARQLLWEAPLFLPCIQNPKQKKQNLIIFGSSRCAYWIIKEAIAAVWLPEYPLYITMIAPKAKQIEANLRQECPGLFPAGAKQNKKQEFLQFISCRDLRELDLSSGSSLEVTQCLRSGNYFVVATEDDLSNLEFAITLRSALLSQSMNFSDIPFIAMRCTNTLVARQVRCLAIGTEPLGYQWFNNYDLKCFGVKKTAYSFQHLENNTLERRARMIHCSYYEVAYKSEEAYEAMGDYFRRHYNRDSSRSMALSLTYRIFAAGIALPNWELYGQGKREAELAEQYDTWLADDFSRVEAAAKLEHERWNRFMWSRGWQSPSIAQVEAYIRQGNFRQQLYVAKLHPYICEWDKLKSVYEEIRHHLKRLAEKDLGDPYEIDRSNVRRTSEFLKIE